MLILYSLGVVDALRVLIVLFLVSGDYDVDLIFFWCTDAFIVLIVFFMVVIMMIENSSFGVAGALGSYMFDPFPTPLAPPNVHLNSC
jgi:hypothetical protein